MSAPATIRAVPSHWFRTDGTYYSRICQARMQRERGTWKVLIDLPHVAFGRTFPVLAAEAVFDDQGSLVLVAGDDGKVVLS